MFTSLKFIRPSCFRSVCYCHSKRRISGIEIIAIVTSSKVWIPALASVIGMGGIYYYYSDVTYVYDSDGPLNYNQIRSEIRSIMYDVSFDDGCLGPQLLRLSFNQCATYSKYDGLGGSNGASLRFEPECSMKHNLGLLNAIRILQIIKEKYSKISISDLWVLASYVAIEEMGGPFIEFIPGRIDAESGVACMEEERFPESEQGATRLLDWFDRMSLTDREAVALMGAHSCGRLHSNVSGIEGSWTSAQILSNEYFKQIKFVPYVFERRGCEHYFDPANPELCLLPIEGAFFYCARVMRWAEFYAYADLHVWTTDFATVWKKVTELGCNFV